MQAAETIVARGRADGREGRRRRRDAIPRPAELPARRRRTRSRTGGRMARLYEAADGLPGARSPAVQGRARPARIGSTVDLQVDGAPSTSTRAGALRLQGRRPGGLSRGVRLAGRQEVPASSSTRTGSPASTPWRSSSSRWRRSSSSKTSVDMRIDSACPSEGRWSGTLLGPAEELRALLPAGRAADADPERRPTPARSWPASPRAFRRPVDDRTLDRLVGDRRGGLLAAGQDVRAGVGAGDGGGAGVAAVPVPGRGDGARRRDGAGASAPVDEYALASRLSYFLWSTMPDDELIRLAERGRAAREPGGPGQADAGRPAVGRRSSQNFVGQWLQARDVEGIAIDARPVLARDKGRRRSCRRSSKTSARIAAEQRSSSSRMRPGRCRPARCQTRPAAGAGQAPVRRRRSQVQPATASAQPLALFAKPAVELDEPLRLAMRRETEMFFGDIVREDRSLLDLLDSDYTFLNERLAKHYGIPGVTGERDAPGDAAQGQPARRRADAGDGPDRHLEPRPAPRR